MILVGDVHGCFDDYVALTARYDKEKVIQMGDFGVGMPGCIVPPLPTNHFFYRGNHDAPEACRAHAAYLGDLGLVEPNVFFLSGAESIDKKYRVEGVSWWKEEELSYARMQEAIDAYVKAKPRVMLSHDCPRSVSGYTSRTSQALQVMFELHQPERWYYAHHHMKHGVTKGKTRFRCVDILEAVELKESEYA